MAQLPTTHNNKFTNKKKKITNMPQLLAAIAVSSKFSWL
jgi:hypothetical protein